MRGAAIVVLMTASGYLLVLGLSALTRRQQTFTFLAKFAQTTRANIIEMSCRFMVGLALAILAPELPYPMLVRAFSAVLMVSALLLLALPWFHRRFANLVLPRIEPVLPLIGVTSLAAGLALVMILLPLMADRSSPY